MRKTFDKPKCVRCGHDKSRHIPRCYGGGSVLAFIFGGTSAWELCACRKWVEPRKNDR